MTTLPFLLYCTVALVSPHYTTALLPAHEEAMMLPHATNEEHLTISHTNVALIDTAMHSVQQDIHQMRHVINFTKRHACVEGQQTVSNTIVSNDTVICTKAQILMNLLKEAEEVAAALDLDTYNFHRQRFSSREVASLLLQGVGLLGAAISFTYITYFAVASVFVTGVLMFEIVMDLPLLIAKAMYIPFFFIAVEIFFFGYFLVGSFSLLVVLASVVESSIFVFGHNPKVLECAGLATLCVALLSLSKPITQELGSDNAKMAEEKTKSVTDAEGKDVACGPELVSAASENTTYFVGEDYNEIEDR